MRVIHYIENRFQPELLYHAVQKGDGNDPDGVKAVLFDGVIHW